MDQTRLDRARQAMARAGLDAVFVTNPKNVLYLAGMRPMMEGIVLPMNDPEFFALVQPARCDVLCDGRYFGEARAHCGESAQLLEAPVTPKVIAAKIREILASSAKSIGYERDALLYGDAVELMSALPGLKWQPAEEMLAGLRVRKTQAEIGILRKAQDITCDALDHIAKTIRLGMSEKDVALEIGNYLRSHSDGNSFNPIVAFGETGCHPHYLPDPTRKLQQGQMVLLDFGSVHEGYCGDLTRMLVMGRADARQREVYDMVLAAQERCLKGIKPGMTCHDLDALCRDYFTEKKCGEAFMHGTGHGVGLAIHEDPRIKKTFTTRVEPGMVFTVEPGLYFAGWGGVRIEDVIVVTETGHDNLTRASKKLLEITP